MDQDKGFETGGSPADDGEEPSTLGPSTSGSSSSLSAGAIEGGPAAAGEVFARCQAAVDTAITALTQLSGATFAASGSELAQLLHSLGELSLRTDAAEVAVVAEAVERGEPASCARPCTPPRWVMDHSRRYQSGAGASRLVTVAQATRHHETRDILGTAVLQARVPLPCAAASLSEMRRLTPDLNPDAVPTVWHAFVDIAKRGDVTMVHRLREAILARWGRDGLLEKEEEEARRHTVLSPGRRSSDGLVDYLLRLTSAESAVLESGVGAFSAPNPTADQPDYRSADQRRAEALLTVIGRGVAAGGDVPARPKAELLLQIPFSDLLKQTGVAETVGGCDAGTFISPQTARRISCDSAIRPAVLDKYGNPLLIGQSRRLFTPSQVRGLMIRDGHCSFPGCDSPPAWADAHHLIHWADGGPTELDNATLLCGFHHHVVHSRRYAGELVRAENGTVAVAWDLTRGSYDHLIAKRKARAALDRAQGEWPEGGPDGGPETGSPETGSPDGGPETGRDRP